MSWQDIVIIAISMSTSLLGACLWTCIAHRRTGRPAAKTQATFCDCCVDTIVRPMTRYWAVD